MEKNQKNILWFNEVGIEDVPLVGGKNASLGEMYTKLTQGVHPVKSADEVGGVPSKTEQFNGVNVPFGFATTVNFY
ncbi:MAG: hypothetical protein Q8K40_09345, partial [Ignavibacteria bacterium]|nr:hypothetical protein [Ignavibacteria bacterium]